MKKIYIRILSFLLTLCLGIAYLPSIAEAAAESLEDYEKVEIWKRTDIILKSEKEYDNPYKEVELDAVFTHEDGTAIHLYGFWNGGDEWRVRFSPTKVGLWSYEITCSDTENAGLHLQKGKLLAVENTGSTDLDKHGFVRISDNGRYFVYDDGTPFYWLGDTNWQAPNYVSITQCNYPGCACGNQFLHELNDRLAKGFTVYQTYFDSGESDGGGQLETTSEPSMWLDKYDSINPETFSQKFDVMFDTLADCGMVIALGFGVHSNTTESMGKENLDRISRYLTARYASYPVVWITAQEITGNPQYPLWLSSAEIVDRGDGYHHPQGAHMFPMDVNNSYVVNLDKQNWHEFYALQNGHGPTIPTKALYEGYWNNTRSGKVKPFIETEANYEDISCGGFNGYDASRIAAWKANLSGSYGFTYGVTGIWANNYSTAGNTGWLGSFSYEPWYMGLDKPGSYEMTYLANFFKYVDFSSLIPRFNDESYSNLTEETKVVASSEDGRTYVAYFYNSTCLTGELRGLNEGETYSAKWYNPLTGKFVEIADDITVTDGVYVIPEKPTAGDWTLLVTSRTDLGEYASETAYTDSLIDTRTNFAAESTATVSTDNGDRWSAASAIDGDLSTYWCASDGKMPQWFLLDMKEARKFAEIDLILYPGNEYDTEYASFTVEGSLDGKTYTILYTADKVAPTPYQGKDLFRITQDGEYRYLKVTFSEIRTNWATLCEIAVYDTPSEKDSDATNNENILSGAVATASSFSSPDSAPGKAIDGSGSSWWCASDGTLPQWISFDLASAHPFNRFSFLMYGGTTGVSYLIEGSMDQQNWVTVYEGVKETPASAGNSVQISGETDEVCNYRYLRITFTEVTGNWATIVEADFHLSAGDDVLPEYNGVIQSPGVTCTGSYIYTASGRGRNTADALFDADLSTVWVPYAPIGSQTLLMDLREEKELYGIHIILGKNAVLPQYRIEASADGVNWVILADATLRQAQTYTYQDRCTVSEPLSGSFRYVKLLWLNADSNSAVKTIAEIQLFAEGETPAAPKSPDISSLLALYNTARQIGNQNKEYTADSFRKLSLTIVETAGLLSHPDTLTEEEAASAESALRLAYEGLVRIGNLQEIEEEPSAEPIEEPEKPLPAAESQKKPFPAALLGILGITVVLIGIACAWVIPRKKGKKHKN